MRLTLLFTLVILICLSSCSFTKPTHTEVVAKANRPPLPKVAVLIDSDKDGSFELLDLDSESTPRPVQGVRQWQYDFYRTMRYPPHARENGITGIVVLNVDIDERGKVGKVDVKIGIAEDCDTEAILAFTASTKNGYTPLLLNGVPTQCRMEVPIGFWLN